MSQQSLYNSTQYVAFVPFGIVHRAAFEMAEDYRRYNIWQDEFELAYNVKFGVLNVGNEKYCLKFPTEQDYTMFMLRWA